MTKVQPLTPADLRQALAYLLPPPGNARHASQAAVSSFCDYLELAPVEWEGVCCGPPDRPTGLFFALLLPGRTAIVMIPRPNELGIAPADQLETVLAGLDRLGPRGLHYAQTLLEPQAQGTQALVKQAGFQPLASLVYLERSAAYPWVEPPGANDAEWVPYDAALHREFATVVLATYEDSLDCPELTGLRPIDDILAAHWASGKSDAGLWELARVDGRSAGCLLLARLTHEPALEVVYMGVVPAFRGRDFGAL